MTASRRPEEAPPFLAPEKILQQRYRIVRQLGRGGMGAVYEAVDQRLGITVALKETFSAEESTRKQFEHEARLLAGMQHPALPRVSDHFVEGDRAFLVMQFIGGVDLARIIAQQPGPFPRDQVIAWADQLLDALIYLHSRDRQVIHRDIKPHNLKLTATGQIALLDFGLAKAQPADTSVTASRAFFGYSRHYAPLEQIQDQRTDPRSDIYALGATLYHLLTGIKPPDALVRASALVNSEPDPLLPANRVHASVGEEIAGILNKAMAQKSEHRYASAQEFREALRRVGRDHRPVAQVGTAVRGDKVIRRPRRVELPDLKLPMVASARHFGPGAMTAVIVLVFTLAVGVLYGSQKWAGSREKLKKAASTSRAAIQRTNSVVRKSERVRPADTSLNLKRSMSSDATSTSGREVTRSEGSRAEKTRRSVTPKSGRRVEAPSIRLPNPEVAFTPVSDLR